MTQDFYRDIETKLDLNGPTLSWLVQPVPPFHEDSPISKSFTVSPATPGGLTTIPLIQPFSDFASGTTYTLTPNQTFTVNVILNGAGGGGTAIPASQGGFALPSDHGLDKIFDGDSNTYGNVIYPNGWSKITFDTPITTPIINMGWDGGAGLGWNDEQKNIRGSDGGQREFKGYAQGLTVYNGPSITISNIYFNNQNLFNSLGTADAHVYQIAFGKEVNGTLQVIALTYDSTTGTGTLVSEFGQSGMPTFSYEGETVSGTTYNSTNIGGSGGNVNGTVKFEKGSSYKLVVGTAGTYVSATTNNGGVGAGGTSYASSGTWVGGSGGGFSGIFKDSISQANALLVAGGGGGTAQWNTGFGGDGGNGNNQGIGNSGGTDGNDGAAGGGLFSLGGLGGKTDSVIGGTPNIYDGESGTALQGGSSATGDSRYPGGGGGGGYYGGGAGTGGDNYGGGGGGGSSYIVSNTNLVSVGATFGLIEVNQNAGGSFRILGSTTGTSAFFTGIATASFAYDGANKTGYIAYQWYEVGVGVLSDGTNITGTATTTLSLLNLSSPIDDNRSFYLQADFVPSAVYRTGNALNEPLVSNTASLTLAPFIDIVAQPSSAFTLQGTDATFTVDANLSNSTTEPLAYQWQIDGIDVDDGNITYGGSGSNLQSFSLISGEIINLPDDADNITIRIASGPGGFGGGPVPLITSEAGDEGWGGRGGAGRHVGLNILRRRHVVNGELTNTTGRQLRSYIGQRGGDGGYGINSGDMLGGGFGTNTDGSTYGRGGRGAPMSALRSTGSGGGGGSATTLEYRDNVDTDWVTIAIIGGGGGGGGGSTDIDGGGIGTKNDSVGLYEWNVKESGGPTLNNPSGIISGEKWVNGVDGVNVSDGGGAGGGGGGATSPANEWPQQTANAAGVSGSIVENKAGVVQPFGSGSAGQGGASKYDANYGVPTFDSPYYPTGFSDGFAFGSYTSASLTTVPTEIVTVSGTKTNTLTIKSDSVSQKDIRCIVSHGTANNSPITTDTVIFSSLSAAQSATINIEKIGVNNLNVDNQTFYGASFTTEDLFTGSVTLPITTATADSAHLYHRIYAPDEDVEVEMDFYGGKGQDAQNGNILGGEGGFARIRFTMEKNTEYIIAGLNDAVNTPFLYRKATLIACVGQGGSAGVQSHRFELPIGGAGGGVNLHGEMGGGGQGTNPGGFLSQLQVQGDLNLRAIFGSLQSPPMTADDLQMNGDGRWDIQETGRNGGRTVSCTKGTSWVEPTGNHWGQGMSPCADLWAYKQGPDDMVQFRAANGLYVDGTAELYSGYKTNYDVHLTGGKAQVLSAGDGGNGASGGTAGTENHGGGGGSGYSDGSVTVVDTQVGGSTSSAKVVIRLAQ